ncbi:MAG TPA: hypothetical protein VFW46_20090 [Stellaceae bacterium]|nr:hypothetical protein [Stellaceae bacterium]
MPQPEPYRTDNLWDEWYPESRLAALLAGEKVEANIGQVRGAWKRALEKEVRAGRLAKWRGFWFPTAGAPHGIGPLKTCYGKPELKTYFAEMAAGLARRAA